MTFVFFSWKRDSTGTIMKKDGQPILQFVAIKRGDTQEWALPGVTIFCLYFNCISLQHLRLVVSFGVHFQSCL